MNKRKQILKYIFCDALSAIVAWALLFAYRKYSIENLAFNDVAQVFGDSNFWKGIVIIPIAWLLFYTFMGTYKNVFRKSRLKELQETAVTSIIGVVVIFFALMLDDNILTYKNYYLSFLFLLLMHFSLTYFFRLYLTTQTVKRVHQRKIGYPTLLVGSGPKALKTYLDLESQEISSGNRFVGYCKSGSGEDSIQGIIPCMDEGKPLNEIINLMGVEEVIVALEDSSEAQKILNLLYRRDDVIVKITADTRDIILGSVKLNSMFHSPLITINTRLMEEWQYSIKRLMDILVSLVAIIVLLPVYLFTALMVKLSSPGPVFYAQERIGYGGKPFKMHKFRSMYVNSEQNGPALSKENDPRITPWGRFMRKVRLDEIPQFYNVLKGTMSLVGPRPERQFFIDQIVEKAPEYLMLQKIKPGITSWGQVKYGYAENVDQMVERLKYDLLYLENMSLTTDIKILLYTVIIVVQGRGK